MAIRLKSLLQKMRIRKTNKRVMPYRYESVHSVRSRPFSRNPVFLWTRVSFVVMAYIGQKEPIMGCIENVTCYKKRM